jgi:HK97 family phage portal protein
MRKYAENVARAFVPGPGAVPDPGITNYLAGFGLEPESRTDYGAYIQTSNAVYTAARIRASLLSSLPIVAYRVGPDGRKDKVTAGPLVELLSKVNPFWTFQRMVEMTELSLCLWGSAYIFLDRGTNRRGRPMEMWWARPDRVTVVPDKEAYVSHFLYQVGSDQEPMRFERDEVIWLRYPNPLDEFDGLSPLASAAIAADTSRAAMISNAAMFRNGLQLAGVVQPANGQTLTEEQARGLEQSMSRRFKGADKAHRWGVLRFEAKFQPLSVTPKDAEYLGSLKWSLEEICRAYGVPLDLVGGERTYANQKDARLAIWTDTIQPEARFIATELTEQLLPLFPGVADVVEFDLSGVAVLQEAEAAKWTIEKEQIVAGALTVNEWRASKGFDPLPWGEAWWAQASLVPVIDTGVGIPPAEPTPPPAPTPEPVPVEEPRSHRAVADVDLRPTEEIAAVARRALAWKEDGRPGGTAVGLARANQLANRERVSPETIARMKSFFARHEVDKEAEGFSDGEDGYPSPGRVAWDLWGGDPGRAWAERKQLEIEREQEAGRTIVVTGREYGDPEHVERFAAWVRRLEPEERRFGNAVADLMRRQRQAVLARVKSERSARTIEDAAENPFELARWIREFRVVMRPIYRDIIAAAGQDGLAQTGVGMAFDVLDPRVVRFMERQIQRFAEEVNQTTWDALRVSLGESIAAGEDVLKAADRVNTIMGDRIRSSAEAIARTEVGTAVNGGQEEGWRQSGVVGGKRWLSAIDDRTRPDHVAAHDQAVAMDEPFTVGGEQGMYPGDFPSARNVVNCRCTMVPISDTEWAAMQAGS